MALPPVGPDQEPPRPSPLERARATALRARTQTERRARRLLRRQLTRARSSDSELLQRAYVLGRQGARAAVNTVTHRQVGWVATLWGARWLDGTTYEIRGWAYERGYGHTSPPQVEVVVARRGGTRLRVRADVTSVHEMEVNAFATQGEFDYANTAFVARMDLAGKGGHTAARQVARLHHQHGAVGLDRRLVIAACGQAQADRCGQHHQMRPMDTLVHGLLRGCRLN